MKNFCKWLTMAFFCLCFVVVILSPMWATALFSCLDGCSLAWAGINWQLVVKP